jgi:hypothetical protein
MLHQAFIEYGFLRRRGSSMLGLASGDLVDDDVPLQALKS